jgi:hypothetical protein
MATATKTRKSAAAPAKSAPAARKPRATAVTAGKSTAKAPAKGTAKPTSRAKKSAPAPEPVKPTASFPTSIAGKKPWTAGSKINKRTGFTEGTISDKIAMALIKGGSSRAAIANAIEDLPEETKKGTKFQPANVAATVERQMRAMGFQVVQQYKLVPPKRTQA